MEASDRAITLPDGASLLHIGMPKSGTSALQAAFDHARDVLDEHGIANLSRNRHEMKVALTAAGTLAGYWGDHWQNRWLELAEDFRTSPARCTLWSSETLSQAAPDRIQYIADQLGRDDVHVVLTLRSLAPQMASQWQQYLRRRGTVGINEWMRAQFDAVGVDGTVHASWKKRMPTLHRFSLRRVVEEWGSVFGEDRLIFVVPPPGDYSFNLRAFESLMGMPDGALVLPEHDNASLPFPEAEMLRHFNRAYTERGGEHRTWMFTVGTHGKREINRLTGLQPAKIQTPRWAAELANQHSEGWIRAIEQSSARVVGSLEHLLVDPMKYPEKADEPQSVSVESAGQLADIFFESALEFDGEPDGLMRTARTRRDAQGEQGQEGQVGGDPAVGNRPVNEAPASELVTELGRRVRRRLGRRVRGK